jgi:UTP-glucose-1-phosphate uridylyltransferase
MEFDTSFNFIDMYFDERIPEYLLNNETSNFITKKQIENIVSKIKLKKAVSPLYIRLRWNIHTGIYEWQVFNTLYKEKCLSKEEVLMIDAISGEINYHDEETHRVSHCIE